MSCMEGAGCLSFFRMRDQMATVWIERFLFVSVSAVRNSRSILSIFFFLISLLSFSSIFSFFLSISLSHTHSLTLTLSPYLPPSLYVCVFVYLYLSRSHTHTLSLSLSLSLYHHLLLAHLSFGLPWICNFNLNLPSPFPGLNIILTAPPSDHFPFLSSYLYPSEKSGSIVTASW